MQWELPCKSNPLLCLCDACALVEWIIRIHLSFLAWRVFDPIARSLLGSLGSSHVTDSPKEAVNPIVRSLPSAVRARLKPRE